MSATTSFRDRGSRRFGIAVSAAVHAALIGAIVFFWPGHRERLVHVPKVMSVFIPQETQAPVEPPRPRPVTPTARPKPTPPAPAPVMATPSLTPIEPVATSPITPVERVEAPTTTVALPAASAPPAPAPAPPAITPPRHDAAYLSNPPPRYPPIARRNGEQGRVVLRVLVTPEGAAETVEVRTSSGSERLDRAALETVRNWRFVPARQGERAVSAWVLVPITFALDS